jgi:hypothetical protein
VAQDETMPAELDEPAARGLKPGDLLQGVSWPSKAWIIRPENLTQSQAESLRRLRDRAARARLTVSEAIVGTVRGHGGLKFSLLSATDVKAMYRSVHRARVCVFALCGAQVLLDISERPSNKGCMSLERFVAHKCFYALVSRPEEVERTFIAGVSWISKVHCDGPRDPRCLPAAVFRTRNYHSLVTPDDRARFLASYRANKRTSDLIDEAGREWCVGPCHGLDQLQVAGHSLPVGFHWDVNAPRRGTAVIATGWERWLLPKRGYTNVSPDATIRGGSATKTHSATGVSPRPLQPRTPRTSRSGK